MKGRFELTGFNKVMVIYLVVLAVALTVLSILERCGIYLIYSGVTLGGVVLLLWSLMVWGAVALFRRFRRPAFRAVGGIALALVVMLAGMLMMQYTMMFIAWMLPYHYATIDSPDGGSVVLMRGWDLFPEDEAEDAALQARMDARRDALLAGDATAAPEAVPEAEAPEAETATDAGAVSAPEAEDASAAETAPAAEDGEAEEYPTEAFGYVYTAYPSLLGGYFYRVDGDSEGEIYLGNASQARIRYDWLDGDTVHIYLLDAEPGDEGEIVVHK